MTGHMCDGAIINLKSATWLMADLLRSRYSTDMIGYFDIEADYRPLP